LKTKSDLPWVAFLLCYRRFSARDMARTIDMENVILPQDFVAVLQG
jgi:hypothetical protein